MLIKIRKILIEAAKSYLSGILVYGIGILLIRNLGYYQRSLSPLAQKALIYLYLGYVLIGALYCILTDKVIESKPLLLLSGLKKLLFNVLNPNAEKISKEEKIASLFILVKFFFLPIMTDFFFDNLNSLANILKDFKIYSFAITLVFVVDTLIFVFGYAFEFSFLKNRVKSVEPTFFGWFVALVCYPPFNSYVGKLVPWGANDYVYFWNSTLTIMIRFILFFLLLAYLWASIALGAKASNLTNRGIVSKFPYSVVRHPAYSGKCLAWWITLLPVMNLGFALGMLFWTLIYCLRAVTEERHLRQDEDYVKYCQKVRYRFIPYVI